MAALLAGARLLLRRGARLLPVYPQRASVAPVRCLSGATGLFTAAAQDKDDTEAESALVTRARDRQEVWSVHEIGSILKRFGRIRNLPVLKSFNEICKTGKLSSNEAWFFLRICGSLMPQAHPEKRLEAAHTIWNKLKELDVELNTSLYNTLLSVYLQNDHEFSPTEFLAEMEAANVEPDQDTYQGLIAAYCNTGDIDGASQILGFMKSKNFPITEEVFDSLIKGHSRAGDMESATNILSIMRSSGIEPGCNTHVALLTAYAERGDIENIRQILNDSEINVPQKELIPVIFALVKSGHSQYVPDVLEHMPNCANISQAIMNLTLALLTQGYHDAAIEVMKRLDAWKPANASSKSQAGDFFLRHCVDLEMPISEMKKVTDQLSAAEMHSHPKEYLLQCALKANKLDLTLNLVRSMKAEGMSFKIGLFRPMVDHLCKTNDLPGLINLLKSLMVMGLNFEVNTLNKCMQFIFSEENADHPIVQDEGYLKDLEKICTLAVKRSLFFGFLENLRDFLSSLPVRILKDKTLVLYIADSFIKYKDVDNLAKITWLLYKDDPDSKEPTKPSESFGYFLYYFIDRVTQSDVQAMEPPLTQYIQQLKEMGLMLDIQGSRGIKHILARNGLNKINMDMVEMVKSGPSYMAELTENAAVLEENLVALERDNLPVQPVLLKLLEILRITKDLPKALQLKSKYENYFTFAMYMKLLDICCDENNMQEVLKLRKEIQQRGFSEVLSKWKYIKLLRVLTENDLIQDAINVLMEMQEKNVPLLGYLKDFLDIFQNMALKGDVQALNLFHEYSVMMGLISPGRRTCSPLVYIHLKKNDLPAAVNAMIQCIEKYKVTPLSHDVISMLVEKGETDLLKKVVDCISNLGEQDMLHDLFFAFIRTGNYSEAKKIVETPGLRVIPAKLNWFTDRCIRLNQMDKLEKCVELSENLFDCNREDLYFKLFKIYDTNNEWEKAKSAWYKMMEENVEPSAAIITLVKQIFHKNNQDVHVHIPDLPETEKIESETTSFIAAEGQIKKLCQGGKVAEAFFKFRTLEENNHLLHAANYTLLIKGLVAEDLMKEALEVEAAACNRTRDQSLRGTASNLLISDQVRRSHLKDALVTLQTMVENGIRIQSFSLYTLLKVLALNGDVSGLEKIGELELNRLPSHMGAWNLKASIVLAHLKKGNLDEGISMLENIFLNEKVYTGFVMTQLMDNMEEALEKVTILAERMANQFANYRPITDLFLNYIKVGRVEEANRLLERYSVIEEQRAILTRFISTHLKLKKNEVVVHLVELLFDPFYKQFLYTIKIKQCEVDHDVDAAVALYEKARAENVELSELSLKRVAALLTSVGKPVPFHEPPETIEYYLKQHKEELSSVTEEDTE